MKMAGVEASSKTNANHECGGCGKRISDRFLLKAVDLYWHEDCLKCGCCDCRLGEVGSTLYKKANLLLCKRDYLRLFGTTGHCAACNKVIPAFEMVMRAKTNVYHLECFACQQCNHRFCVGDRFYLCDNKILCEYDYEERMVFANMSYSSDSLAHIKRQVSDLQQPPEESGMGQRGPPPPPSSVLPPQHHLPPQAPHQPQPQQQQQQQQPQPPHQPPPAQSLPQHHVGLNGGVGFPSPLPSPLPNGPSTSSGLIQGGGSIGNPSMMGEPGGVGGLKGASHPPMGTAGPGINGAAGDDASSGYGSPDSLTLEDR